MLDFIRGQLTVLKIDHVVIDHQGLGYKIFTPVNLFSKSLKIGEEVTLYLCPIYREDSQKLYGFISRTDQESFEKLLNVTGIGPKSALSLVGHLECHDLEGAILANNTTLLSKIPGIGKKTAERLVLELKDKVKKTLDKGNFTHSTHQDATFALINLGYPEKEALKMIEKAVHGNEDLLDLPNLIKKALQLTR
jgi:Holliday junction DNA helicase RuvA